MGVIIVVILATLLQLLFCKFTLWLLIGIVCRLLFSLRYIGVIFKTKPIFVVEVVALAVMFVWYFLFKKDALPWLRIGLNILFVGIVVFVEWLDGMLYVYEVLDAEDVEE